VNPELRARISATRFRVPDVCVRYADAPREKVLTTPPLIAIEILAPEDHLPHVLERLEDYHAMGVSNIWLIDPGKRAAYVFDLNGLGPNTMRLEVPSSGIFVSLPEIFSTLD
jgi:Uma2 family endonuclease